jgi:hypothetical protein
MQNLAVEGASNSIADQFLAILPSIHVQLGVAFRRFRLEERDDALQEATVNAYVAFVRLWRRGRTQLALPTPLALYAVRNWFAGRRVASPLNGRDVTSLYAQRKHGLTLERLDRFDGKDRVWREIMIEDRRTPVPDQAAFRIDFPTWLQQLSQRDRMIAITLAERTTTSDAAKRFKLSWARVSQLRREFEKSWQQFHGGVE